MKLDVNIIKHFPEKAIRAAKMQHPEGIEVLTNSPQHLDRQIFELGGLSESVRHILHHVEDCCSRHDDRVFT